YTTQDKVIQLLEKKIGSRPFIPLPIPAVSQSSISSSSAAILPASSAAAIPPITVPSIASSATVPASSAVAAAAAPVPPPEPEAKEEEEVSQLPETMITVNDLMGFTAQQTVQLIMSLTGIEMQRFMTGARG